MPLSKIQFGNTGRRNLIINGAMQVHQRGNQTNTSGSQVYFVDRWNFYENTGALAANLQQSTVVPSGQGFGNSLLIDCTTVDSSVAASHLALLRQVIEGQDLQRLAYGTSNAKSLTVSFWVRSSNTISSADTWEFKSITFSGDTSATIDNDNQATFYVQWALSAGSDYTSGTQATTWTNFANANRFGGQVNFFDNTSNNFYLTGVQMEVGDTATDFEHRSFAEELQLCKRYFQNIGGDGYPSAGFIYNDLPMFSFPFPVVMRVAPSGSVQGNGSALSSTNATGQTNYSGSTTSNLNIYKSGNRNYLTGGSWSGSGNDRGNAVLGNQNVNFDAEL